jgi:hypothetical protein
VKILFKEKYFEYSNIIGSTCSSSGSFSFKNEYAKLSLAKIVYHLLQSRKNTKRVSSDINYQLNKGIEE